MITEKNATAINNSGLGVQRYSLVMTPEVFKVFYSSLYEDKELAVLRELASNGDDGHTAAGKKDTPVVIHLPTELVPELTIVDQGIGMSLEDIKNNYTTYGKSTKRDSNTEIGGFGYGAKSPFAIAQSFTVESTKDGITTIFVNFIDEDGPNYTIISSKQTGNPSGTKVVVPVADKQMQRMLAVKATGNLFSLWSTPPDIKNIGSVVPIKYKVLSKKSTHYEIEVSSYNNNQSLFNQVTTGPFIYKIPVNMLERLNNNKDFKFLSSIYQTTGTLSTDSTRVVLLPNFGVGELELSPSRERIEDTKENEQRIIDRIKIIADSYRYTEEDALDSLIKSHKLALKYGTKVSDLVGRIQEDHIITFKNRSDLLAEILPAGWEHSAANIAAVYAQSTQSIPSFNKSSDMPDGLVEILVPSMNIGVTRLCSKGVDGRERDNSVFTLAGILSTIAREVDTNSYVSRFVIRHLEVMQRTSRTYRIAQSFTDQQTIIVVPHKMKPRVSRCLNYATTSWSNPSCVFTDTPDVDTATLIKTATTLGIKFNFVYEDEIKAVLKTIPKTVRAVVPSSTPAVKVDRIIGKRYVAASRDYVPIHESEIDALLSSSPTLLLQLTNSNKMDYVISNGAAAILELKKINIIYITESEYKTRKYVSKIYDEAVVKYPTSFVKYETDTYDVMTHLTKYLSVLPDIKDINEQLTAKSILDSTTFKKMYPKAVIVHKEEYCHNRSSFTIFISKSSKANLLLRCKWCGFISLPDINKLSEVMDDHDLTVVKQVIAEYSQTKIQF